MVHFNGTGKGRGVDEEGTYRCRAVWKGAAEVEDRRTSADGFMDIALPAASAEEVFAGRCMHAADLEVLKADAAPRLQPLDFVTQLSHHDSCDVPCMVHRFVTKRFRVSNAVDDVEECPQPSQQESHHASCMALNSFPEVNATWSALQ